MAAALRILLACLGLALLSACAGDDGRAQRGPLVLAAASLQEALEATADEWEAAGHSRPVLSFAGTAALARQVEAGAGGDLFISADEQWMDRLETDGLLAAGSRQALTGNRLALVAPADSKLAVEVGPEMDLAAALAGGRLAMAEPGSVPAGRYAKEALEALGQWGAVEDRLAIGDNVRVALALVSRAEAPLGVVYRTDAMADLDVRIIGLFPAASHRSITYPMARLSVSTHADAAGFEAFLLSPEGQAIFARFGFITDTAQ